MRLLMTILGVALLGVAARPAVASGPAIDWDPAFFWEAGATPTNSTAGGQLNIVGIISMFDAPFQDLDATNPAVEYTFYAYGLTSEGTVASGPPPTTFYTTHYTGGSISVYYDSTPEATFAPNPPNAQVPSTFTDGTLILEGAVGDFFGFGGFSSFVTQTNNFTTFNTGNAEGEFAWSGGTLVSRTQNCPGLFTGGLTWRPSVMIAGYLFRHDGKIDLNCPTVSRSSTWGTIKALYRR